MWKHPLGAVWVLLVHVRGIVIVFRSNSYRYNYDLMQRAHVSNVTVRLSFRDTLPVQTHADFCWRRSFDVSKSLTSDILVYIISWPKLFKRAVSAMIQK